MGRIGENCEILKIFIFILVNLRISSTLFLLPIHANSRYSGNNFVTQNETFDFIVIGASPSGAAIANRLTENPEWRVLLIEAGEEANFITNLPVISGMMEFTDYSWLYTTEEQDGFCRGCMNKRMIWPDGKALGGSTVINYMINVRGNRKDYDRWAEMGNPGWSYEEVLPYFMKLEDFHVERRDPGYHGTGGYLTIGDVPARSRSSAVFVQAAQEAGHPYVDYNGKKQMGVSYVQVHQRNGRRCSAYSAYLEPFRSRPNLKILTNARAVKILIDPETKEAYGVKFAKNKQYHYAFTKKEVILSAGGLNSPQILMLSGIGPKEHLDELGIPVIRDLPVGQKIYDHATFTGLTFTLNDTIVFDQHKVLTDINSYVNFAKRGTGPLTTIGGVEALVYLRTNQSRDPDPTYPDMELIFIGGALSTDEGAVYRRMFNVPQEMYDKVWKPLENTPAYQVFPMLVHPKSHGYMRLKSKNPFKWPKFYANYFTDPENHDIKTFIASIREIQKINASPAFQKYGATLWKTPIPGCENLVFDSDEYWECSLRTIIGSLHHQVATCKMGPYFDREAIVDHTLRVHGIKKLRVADTSIIPFPLTAHTATPSYMIGEKAADLIKSDWAV